VRGVVEKIEPSVGCDGRRVGRQCVVATWHKKKRLTLPIRDLGRGLEFGSYEVKIFESVL
jgi:hypothetical protein